MLLDKKYKDVNPLSVAKILIPHKENITSDIAQSICDKIKNKEDKYIYLKY